MLRDLNTIERLMSLAETRSLSVADLQRGTLLLIPGGTFRMGSDGHYPEDAPVHRVSVDGFWIDRTPVTNRQFREFVEATGYVTFAEIAPDPKDYPGALPHMLKASSLVFSPPDRRVCPERFWPFRHHRQCLGLDGRLVFNRAPRRRTESVLHSGKPARRAGGWQLRPLPPANPRKVIKGGSHLCAPNCCRHYRPAARHAQPVDTSTIYVGFRCIVRDASGS
nr:SUMF1/EgtB/PvdO family nonheme iron enzyme [Bradyrhizobium sp. 41S5]